VQILYYICSSTIVFEFVNFVQQRSRSPPPSIMTDSVPAATPYPTEAPSIASKVVSVSPVPHTLTTSHSSRSITISGWTVTATKLPICSSSDCDALAAELGIPVPEMTFGNNSVSIEGPNGWRYDFNTRQALDEVDKTDSQGIKVAYSEQWNRTR
jgi:TIP41-like family